MIAWLQGVLMEKQPPLILLDVNGVGYELEAPMTTFYTLPALGETAKLYVHMVVREDAQLLFAFANRQQRELFRSLIKINGVGPKVALAVLSTLADDELIRCVAQEDIAQLTRVPGIGAKTAQRLMVDLKDKLEKLFGDLSVQAEGGSGIRVNARQDAVDALTALGYKLAEAARVTRGLDENLSSEELIRQALQILSGNKIK